MNLSVGIVVAGAFIQAAALVPLFRLISVLPSGGLKKWWYSLVVLVLVFIAGYIATALSEPDLLISGIFFLGSLFVLMVSILSRGIAQYAKRIVVLEQENMTDPLMNIYNRRYLNSRLRKELIRSHKTGRPLSVLLLDIDHFKRVNDRYGHLTGDAVLRQLGPLTQSWVRKSDTVARYGGEELMVIASDTSSVVAGALAERICSAVAQNKFYFGAEDSGGVASIHVTASIGVSTLRQGDDIATLIRRADKALYRAKDEGRNRVKVSPALKLVPTSAAANS